MTKTVELNLGNIKHLHILESVQSQFDSAKIFDDLIDRVYKDAKKNGINFLDPRLCIVVDKEYKEETHSFVYTACLKFANYNHDEVYKSWK